MRSLFKCIICCFVCFVPYFTWAQPNEVHIEVRLKANPSNYPVEIRGPIAGNFFEGNKIFVPADKLAASAHIEASAAGIYQLEVANNLLKLILKPNDHILINFDEKQNFTFSGANAEGQQLLNELTADNTRSRFETLDVEKNLQLRKKLINSLQKTDEEKFIALARSKKIDEVFKNMALQEVAVYYKLLASTDYFFMCKPLIFGVPGTNKSPYQKALSDWSNLYKKMNPSWLKSPLYASLVSRYASYLSVYDTMRDEEIPYMVKDIKLLRNKLKGKYLEYAWAGLTLEGLSRNENEPEWIENFNAFKAAFPQSAMIPKLAPLIENVERYNAAKNVAEVPEVEFLKAAEQINTLDDLLKSLKGEYYYIDMWATWCGPCKSEIQYSIALHDEIEKLGFKQLYLSLDLDNAQKKWIGMTKGFPLKGLNMRANPQLNDDLTTKVPKFIGIPRYLIVGKEGVILNWNAKRPSDGKELLEQLKSYLK